MRLRSINTKDNAEAKPPTHDANFYALPFAGQMIVWATRKRLNAICKEVHTNDDEVLQVFHMANWGGLYAALLAIIDLMVAAATRNLAVHSLGCPCLAPHEAYLLNALAHMQAQRADEAVLCLCEFIPPSAARLALPHLEAVTEALSLQDLRLGLVDLQSFRNPHRPALSPKGNRHVH
jgi:hypothetical protein